MNSPQANSSASTIHREWLTLFAIVMGLAVITLIALVIGVTGYFRLGGDTAALRRVVAEATGQRWSKKVEFNIGSWTTSVAQLGTGFIDMDARAREVLNGVRSAEAGVYRLSQPLDSRKSADLMAATDLAMTARGWDRVVGVRNRDATVIAYVPREAMSPDDVTVCFIVVHGRDVVVGQGRASLEPLISLWRMEQDRPQGFARNLARSR
ncbi:MAG: hypothetical protein H7X97_08965 [Opitutaceae bacterium]|nr:hypothetical protein [Verrucomicrobiales bacterium]